jgi:hypothetical protein
MAHDNIRKIAVDLLDEVLAEDIDSPEHEDAQGGALIKFGDGHDPKEVVRLLVIVISDRLGGAAGRSALYQ